MADMFSRDLLAEARETWTHSRHVVQVMELGPQLRTRLCGGLAAAAAGSLLTAFGAGGTTVAERTLTAAVFALGIGAAVIVKARRVMRDADATFGRSRMATAASRVHLYAWLAPSWLVLLPSTLFTLLSASGSHSAASVIAVVAAAQVWLAAIVCCWLSCPAHCRAIRQEHAEVPPAPAVWLALFTAGYNVAVLASLTLVPQPGSLGEVVLLGPPRLGGLSLLLVPMLVLATILAWLARSLDDSSASTLLGTIWLPLVYKLGGSLLPGCGDAYTFGCGGQAHMVHFTGALLSLLVFLMSLVHFQAAATITQSLVLLDPLLLTPAVACNTLLALVCGAVGSGRQPRTPQTISMGGVTMTASASAGGGDLTTSAVAVMATVLAVFQLQWRWRRGLPTNLLPLNRARDAATVASLVNGGVVVLSGSSSAGVYVVNLGLAASVAFSLASTWLGQRATSFTSRKWAPWERLGSGWQMLPQTGEGDADATRGASAMTSSQMQHVLDEEEEVKDTDLSYHAWLRKKEQAKAAVDRRVCFSFWRDAADDGGGHTVSAHDIDRCADIDDNEEEEEEEGDGGGQTAHGIGLELDALTIREILSEDVRVTFLGLDAGSVSASRVIDELHKLSSLSHSRREVGASSSAVGEGGGNISGDRSSIQCQFEVVEFACPAGELEPWLDDDIVGIQQAIHRALEHNGDSSSACQWTYIDRRDRHSKPLELVVRRWNRTFSISTPFSCGPRPFAKTGSGQTEHALTKVCGFSQEIRRSRLSPDAAECMGWAMRVNPALRSVFLQFTSIGGSLARGLALVRSEAANTTRLRTCTRRRVGCKLTRACMYILCVG